MSSNCAQIDDNTASHTMDLQHNFEQLAEQLSGPDLYSPLYNTDRPYDESHCLSSLFGIDLSGVTQEWITHSVGQDELISLTGGHTRVIPSTFVISPFAMEGSFHSCTLSDIVNIPTSFTPSPHPPNTPAPSNNQDDSANVSDKCEGPTVDLGFRTKVTTKAMRVACNLRKKRQYRFQCSICLESFTTKFSRDRHINTHIGLRYQCRGCPATFGNPSDRQRHEKYKHKKTINQ